MEADHDALAVFLYLPGGQPSNFVELAARVDYLQAYCESVNRALGIKPVRQPRWWRWWG